MTKLKIRISGHTQVINKLAYEFPNRLKQQIAAGLYESTQEVITRAIPLTPRQTGSLRASMKGVVNTHTLHAVVFAGGQAAPYAPYQEFGTYDNRIDENDIVGLRTALKSGLLVKKGRGIAPKLFLHRGLEQSRPRIINIMETKLNTLIAELGLN